MLRVGPSSIPQAGRGVFLTHGKIEEGIVSGFYHGFRVPSTHKFKPRDRAFALGSPTDDTYLLGFYEPMPKYPDHCMQVCNDAGFIDVSQFPFGQPLALQVVWLIEQHTHYIPSIARCNVAPFSSFDTIEVLSDRSCRLPFHAVSEITEGDELFYSYGASYWLSNCNPHISAWQTAEPHKYLEYHHAYFRYVVAENAVQHMIKDDAKELSDALFHAAKEEGLTQADALYQHSAFMLAELTRFLKEHTRLFSIEVTDEHIHLWLRGGLAWRLLINNQEFEFECFEKEK